MSRVKGIDIGLQDFENTLKRVEALQEKSEKAISSTLKEAKKRAPTWVAAEVSKVYNIKKAEVRDNARTRGNSLEEFTIRYRSRPLTVSRFGMTPKEPKPGGGYTLKATILKGNRITLGKNKKLTKKQRANIGLNYTHQSTRNSPRSPIMLIQPKQNNSYLPMQRVSQERYPLRVIKTVSIPQMVASERVKDNVQRVLTDNVSKRLEHYIERNLGDR